jgi:hypothetical protein
MSRVIKSPTCDTGCRSHSIMSIARITESSWTVINGKVVTRWDSEQGDKKCLATAR